MEEYGVSSPNKRGSGPSSQFSPEFSLDRRADRPPLDFVTFCMKSSKVYYNVEESPCLKILRSVKERMGSSTARLKGINESYTSVSAPRKPVDYALFMGRSFRVGWSRSGKIVHCGMPFSKSDPAHGEKFSVVVEGIFAINV